MKDLKLYVKEATLHRFNHPLLRWMNSISFLKNTKYKYAYGYKFKYRNKYYGHAFVWEFQEDFDKEDVRKLLKSFAYNGAMYHLKVLRGEIKW